MGKAEDGLSKCVRINITLQKEIPSHCKQLLLFKKEEKNPDQLITYHPLISYQAWVAIRLSCLLRIKHIQFALCVANHRDLT